jgi:hypothetical protein
MMINLDQAFSFIVSFIVNPRSICGIGHDYQRIRVLLVRNFVFGQDPL